MWCLAHVVRIPIKYNITYDGITSDVSYILSSVWR